LVVEKGLTIGGKSLKEHLEAINLSHAIEYVRNLAKETKNAINNNVISNIHSMILRGIDKNGVGVWRTIAVKISGSEVILPDPVKVPDLMDDLIDWLQKTDEDPVDVALDFHLKFVSIHPFMDGNGRTARLLMNVLLLQAGYVPICIEPAERLNYINSIENAQLTGNTKEYKNFMYTQVEKSIDVYLEAIKRSNLIA